MSRIRIEPSTVGLLSYCCIELLLYFVFFEIFVSVCTAVIRPVSGLKIHTVDFFAFLAGLCPWLVLNQHSELLVWTSDLSLAIIVVNIR